MWDLDDKENWVPKNWCFWTVVLEKTLESPLDCKELKPVNPKGNQSWMFIERTDAEAPILWPPHAKSWLIGKDPDAGKDWGQEEKGMTEDKVVEWHHGLDGQELEKFQEMVENREAWCAAVHGVTKSWIQLRDWTELKEFLIFFKYHFALIDLFQSAAIVTLFVAQADPSLASGSPVLSCFLSTGSYWSLIVFLIFCGTESPVFSLYISCPRLGPGNFSEMPLVLFSRKCYFEITI